MQIKLRQDLEFGKDYNGLTFLDGMKSDKLLDVVDIDYEDGTLLAENSTRRVALRVAFYYTFDMVESFYKDGAEVRIAQVYVGGDMLTGGSQLLREKEKEDIRYLGFKVYNPQDNKDINDKQAQGNAEDLPDRIVAQDTKALVESDIVVIEPQPYALGTLVELGQLKGMKDMSEAILKIIIQGGGISEITDYCIKMNRKPIYPHYEDIRRHNEPEVGDNRSLGINAYVYGVCKDLTRGKGFYDWEEIQDILAESKVLISKNKMMGEI